MNIDFDFINGNPKVEYQKIWYDSYLKLRTEDKEFRRRFKTGDVIELIQDISSREGHYSRNRY